MRRGRTWSRTSGFFGVFVVGSPNRRPLLVHVSDCPSPNGGGLSCAVPVARIWYRYDTCGASGSDHSQNGIVSLNSNGEFGNQATTLAHQVANPVARGTCLGEKSPASHGYGV